MYLSTIRRIEGKGDVQAFPWTLDLFSRFEELELDQPITFLVGENGSGKSTLLEGMAAGMQAVAMGRLDMQRDPSLVSAQNFAKGCRFLRRRAPKRKMFMRAEDVFGFVNRVKAEILELDEMEQEVAAELEDGSWGQTLARGVIRGQRKGLERRYGEDPDALSHGQTFLELLKQRLLPNGLYFLDEPEAPLSPKRILSLIIMLEEAVEAGCQFIIATHSPILMAARPADILMFEEGGIRKVDFNEVEHVWMTRRFLNNPEAMLRHLRTAAEDRED